MQILQMTFLVQEKKEENVDLQEFYTYFIISFVFGKNLTILLLITSFILQ
jgi:hypothetical protein